MKRAYKYYDLVMAAFVTVLITSGVIGAPKVSELFGFSFGSAVIFFPFSYIFGDILTEVYGYARTRRVVWVGFTALIFASLMSYIVVLMPPAPGWPDQAAYEAVFLPAPRIALTSVVAYWSGEFANSYIMARMKILSSGRWLWTRTIGSTLVGQAVDSLIFYPIAFAFLWDWGMVVTVMVANYLIKVGVEAILTPVTYAVVHFLKKKENEDYYDYGTDFNPFHLSETDRS